jgi:hypothetical protein
MPCFFVVELGREQPELILNPIAPKVVVDEQESFDSVNLVKQQCKLSLAERIKLRALLGTLRFHLLVCLFDLFVQSLELLLGSQELVMGVLWYFGGFGVLQSEKGLS